MTARQRFWLVGAGYTLVALVFTAPLSFHMLSRVFSLDSDALLVQWIVAWDIHAFTHQPLHIFDANTFAPLPNTLAFAENLIGGALFAAPVFWLTHNLALAINLVSVLSIPVSGLGTYLLARRLKLSEAAAILAGLIFAFTPPRFLRIEQFQLTTIHWLPFCLAYVHAYLDEGRARDLRLALLFFSLQALSGGHGATFLTTAIIALLLWRFLQGEPLRLVQRVKDAGIVGALCLLPTILVFLPYRDAQAHEGLVRNLDGWDTAASSFFASPSFVDVAILNHFPAWLREQPDAYLFPGWLPLLLVAAGLLTAIVATPGRRWIERSALLCEVIAAAYLALAVWAAVSASPRLKIGEATVMTVRHAARLWLGAALALALRLLLARAVPLGDRWRRIGAVMARQRHNALLFYALLTLFCTWLLFGPPFGIWPLVYKWPVLNFIRVPTRFVLLAVLGLAVLAGAAFDRLSRTFSARARVVTATLVCLLTLGEFVSSPLEGRPYDPSLPKIDVWLNTLPTPFTIAEWPMPNPDNVDGQNARNARFMRHSIAHFQKTVHGFSGILPKAHEQLFGALYSFPNDDSLQRLRAFGVTYVVWHDDFTDPKVRAETDATMAPWAGRIQFVHEEADGRVYRLVR